RTDHAQALGRRPRGRPGHRVPASVAHPRLGGTAPETQLAVHTSATSQKERRGDFAQLMHSPAEPLSPAPRRSAGTKRAWPWADALPKRFEERTCAAAALAGRMCAIGRWERTRAK